MSGRLVIQQNSDACNSRNSHELGNSRIQCGRSAQGRSSHACARVAAGLPAVSAPGACARTADGAGASGSCLVGPLRFAQSFAAVAANACAGLASVRDTAQCSGSQVPRGTRGSKVGVSRPSEDKDSDPKGIGTFFGRLVWCGGRLWGPVQGGDQVLGRLRERGHLLSTLEFRSPLL